MSGLVFSLRRASADDARAIRRLVYQSMLNPTGLDWRRFWVAVSAQGEVIGCGQVKPHRDGSRELASIVVRSEARRQGVARALIQALIQKAEEAGDLTDSAYPGLFLTCRQNLEPFYARFGFRAIPEAQMPPHFQRISRLLRALIRVSQDKNILLVMHKQPSTQQSAAEADPR